MATAAKAKTALYLSFTKDKETKGTHRFAEDAPAGTRPTIGTIYVTKEALSEMGALDAENINVTIEAA